MNAARSILLGEVNPTYGAEEQRECEKLFNLQLVQITVPDSQDEEIGGHGVSYSFHNGTRVIHAPKKLNIRSLVSEPTRDKVEEQRARGGRVYA